ncbi:MAG: EAL domain-containing protein [Acidobacteria bacterium]|nr:MAG: EAL domain-containing protein [Acidobacteriota bacterium]
MKEAGSAQLRSETSSERQHAQTRVLLIEDNQRDLEHANELLGSCRHRYDITAFDRLGPALEFVRTAPYLDVTLLDFHLPDSKGMETLLRFQAEAPWMPVIVLTSLEDEDLAAAAVRSGAQDYLNKWDVNAKLMERSISYAIERKAAEEALRISEERYALAVKGADDGLWDWDLRSNRIYFSPTCSRMLGWPLDEPMDDLSDWMSRIHPDDVHAVKNALSAHLEGSTPHLEVEHRTVREGSCQWILVRGLALRRSDGTAYRMAGALTNITDRKLAEERLIHSALHDPLTGLPNRALFIDRLSQAMTQRERRPRCAYVVFFMDLDRFKDINDSLGHAVGDQLLVAMARRLETLVRSGDTVSRLGGDEFALLVKDPKRLPDVCAIAERVLAKISLPCQIGNHEVFTTASIGIAAGCNQYRTPDEILRDADIAMYRAKSRGKACYEIFDGAIQEAAGATLTLETDLRQALQKEEFVLHFQPVVDIRTGILNSFEALIRWNHPTRRLLYPGQFLETAEDTRLIVPLGYWVFRHACMQLKEWLYLRPDLALSVNLSPRQLHEPDLCEQLGRILTETGVNPQAIILEISEGTIGEDAVDFGKTLAQIRSLGVRVFLDDFGTGYSSLNLLHRLPYDSLKIDRAFIKDLGADCAAGEIVQAILALARNLGMAVIAEGIETENQLKTLREMGCDLGQGFWFSAPVESGPATAMLHRQASWAIN